MATRKKTMKKKSNIANALVTKSKTEHPEYGRVLRVKYDDGFTIFVTKIGINMSIPKSSKLHNDNLKSKRSSFEFLITPAEIDVLMQALEFFTKEEPKKRKSND